MLRSWGLGASKRSRAVVGDNSRLRRPNHLWPYFSVPFFQPRKTTTSTAQRSCQLCSEAMDGSADKPSHLAPGVCSSGFHLSVFRLSPITRVSFIIFHRIHQCPKPTPIPSQNAVAQPIFGRPPPERWPIPLFDGAFFSRYCAPPSFRAHQPYLKEPWYRDDADKKRGEGLLITVLIEQNVGQYAPGETSSAQGRYKDMEDLDQELDVVALISHMNPLHNDVEVEIDKTAIIATHIRAVKTQIWSVHNARQLSPQTPPRYKQQIGICDVSVSVMHTDCERFELNDVTIDQRQPGMMTNTDMEGSSMKGCVEIKMQRIESDDGDDLKL
uniref:Uncharacterized protein n=1 Tax=Panagrellus redivivus TaxID=6233 RepID=A0A7E4VKM4_PANRE